VIIKEMKTILENLASLTPWSKSDKNNKASASQKKEKYIIPANAKTRESKKGAKSTEIKSRTEKQIRSAIASFYTQTKYKSKNQTPDVADYEKNYDS
jgi:hypothetical protein